MFFIYITLERKLVSNATRDWERFEVVQAHVVVLENLAPALGLDSVPNLNRSNTFQEICQVISQLSINQSINSHIDQSTMYSS